MELEISDSSEISLSCGNVDENELLDEEDMATLTTEIKDDEEGTTCTATITSVSVRRVRVVVSFVGKLVLPAVVGVYYAYLRNKHTLSEVLPTVVAFLTNGIARSLSSVQGAVTNRSKFDPLLRVIKLRYRQSQNNNAICDLSNTPTSIISNPMPTITSTTITATISSSSSTPRLLEQQQQQQQHIESASPEQCVNCTVLSSPPEGEPIRADIIFVHGLHGSIVKTWRQGDWKMAKQRAESVELRRKASTSSLQNAGTPKNKPLKRCYSTNSSDINVRSKIARDEFSDPVFCDCDDALCPICCHTASKQSCDEEANNINNELPSSTPQTNEEPKSECWPRDWLPIDCPGVRVIALTYSTDPYLWRPVWIKEQHRTRMEERSNEMMKLLLELNVGKQPIVWVGHSKGGLFVKQILVDAWERSTKEPLVGDLCLHTKGIMFYSVPHKGSSLADFTVPFVRKSVELLEIGRDCEKVLDLHERFLKLFDDGRFNPEIFSFIETSLTFMAFVYLRIVTYESADPGIGQTCGVPLDHREICKPTSRNCFLYQELVELILRST